MSFNKNLLLFCFCLNFSLLFGQDKTELSQLSYQRIGDTINRYLVNDLSKAVDAANAYIFKARQQQDITKECEGLNALASTYERHREFKKARIQFEKVLELAQQNELKEQIIASHFLGARIELASTNAAKAIERLESGLKLAEEIDNEYWKEYILQYISYILQMSGDTEKAIDIRKESISFYKNRPIDSVYTIDIKKQALIRSYSEISESFIKVKQLDSAKHYTELLSNLVTPNDSCSQRILYEIKGEIDFAEENYSQAKEKFKQASKLCDPNSPLGDLRMKYDLGKSAHGEGNFEEAKNILQQGLENYDVKPTEEGYMFDYYKILADSYKETGNLERANFYFEKYINSSSAFDKIKSQVKASTKAQEIEKFRSELKVLEAEKEEKQNHLYYLLLGTSLIILVLLYVMLHFYRTKKKNEVKFKALMQKINKPHEIDNITDTRDEVLEEKSSTDVPEETRQQILIGLKRLAEQEYFLKQDCNSYNVARKINTNTSYLSKVINSHFGKNFNTYINDLRINYAILRLKNDVIFRSYSIQSIAEELGYKSADSFSKYFKLSTGLNPSFYIKEIKNIA